ncbi:hypothetical protein Misp02_41210 [Microtetraspora sp. NBRC 16547]|nr:hypothetical protein Misp02_41210 [Microtetraspora sp. NBRC 16547]
MGDAVAVASPGASRRDRLAIRGSTACALPLVRHALAESGPTYRPFGDAELVMAVSAGIEELTEAVGFSWMVTAALAPAAPLPSRADDAAPAADADDLGRVGDGEGGGQAGRVLVPRPGSEPGSPVASGAGAEPRSEVGSEVGSSAGTGATWLEPSADPEVGALLALANPSSYAVPGIPRVSRWAGIRDGSGELVAVAADAWSAPAVGLMAGVATAVSARGRGLAERVCRFVTAALLADHGRSALMVDDWNHSAVRLYERLGYARRRVAANKTR